MPAHYHRLGKRARRDDPRTLHYHRYSLNHGTINVPQEVSFDGKVKQWPMMGNDVLGDCVPAAMGHCVEQWTEYATLGTPTVLTDNQIIDAYSAIGGYVPGDPSTDNGCVMLDALNYWRKVGISNHKILGYANIAPSAIDQIREAIYLFGNAYIGLQMPVSAQGESIWNIGGNGDDPTPGSWGGHCVPVVAMSPESMTVVTWGGLLKMSHNFFLRYCDEAYAVLSQDWLMASGVSPSSFNLTQLQADINHL